jgi:HD-GYP domain-containing protein (c-di-GMP phosphodiesterase class II)
MSYENLSRDLHSILNSYLDLIGCDGGSIYTIQKNLQGENVLVFKAMVTRSAGIRSVPDSLKSVVFRLDEATLVGKTGLFQRVFKENYKENSSPVESKMTADGATAFTGSSPVTGSAAAKSFTDHVINYSTQNILSAPLLTPRGDLVGVVQLVNKLPPDQNSSELDTDFTEKDERLCAIVSSQAALAIENSTLLYEQEKILDGFVNACVTAIEARDPVTAGHSQRVCDLSLELAEAVNKTSTGDLALIHFSTTQMRELRYAAMLHDIGKISVKEDILKKEKKLFPYEMELIEMRFKMMKMALRAQHPGKQEELQLAKETRELEKALQMIKAANEPSLLPQEVSQSIVDLTKLHVHVDEHESCCALTQFEKDRLCIPRGSLSKEERLEIEKHVSFTYEILKMVPWSRGLENVPVIAHRHHEKLDGTGYPQRVKSEMIPTQSRMLTICDIYDALTASDRPYKAAVPVDKALNILQEEVTQGKLDPVLFKLFVDSKSYLLFNFGKDTKKKAA